MKLNKTFLTLGLAAALLQMPASSFAQNAGGSRQNPLLQKSNLPFGAPDFSKIQESDYLPAIEAAIKEQRANIQKIVNNKKKPTFQNTILAFEESGVLLDRVTSIFYGLTSAHRTPAIAETEKKATPMLTKLDNEISFNQKLFERIKYVYDNEYKKLKGGRPETHRGHLQEFRTFRRPALSREDGAHEADQFPHLRLAAEMGQSPSSRNQQCSGLGKQQGRTCRTE